MNVQYSVLKIETMKFFWELCVLILLPIASYQLSSPTSPSYIGAVVEYSPVHQSQNEKSISVLNAENYLKFIVKASQYAVDVIVFPESSLSMSSSSNETIARTEAASYIPDPQDNVVPCYDDKEKYATSLKLISCAANEHRMYVVVNHREKVDCSGDGCPADGFLTYNTNVAFDRRGQVIARYRKYNLFGERGTNITSEPIPSTFTTDFGVTFGLFICFDILFQTPTLNYTRNLGVTDIIFSAHWFSELPYLFSVEAQAAWAYANDANLLAAGYNYPRTASGGSGIYIGRKGYSHVIYENKASNVLVVSEIPKVINGKRSLNINQNMVQTYEFKTAEISTTEENRTGIYLHKTDKLKPYTTELIDLTQSVQNKTICDRGLCCQINLKLKFDESLVKTDTNYYRYRFSVFNGVRSFDGVATGGVKTCGIIHCTDDTFEGCGQIFDLTGNNVKPTTFESIEVLMQEVDKQNTFYMPITFAKDIKPLNASGFFFDSVDSDEAVNHYMRLTKPNDDLLTFAIYGRNFRLDGTEASASSVIFVAPLLILSTILATFLVMC